MKKLVEVFSSGGGTQSTCIAALICQGKLPKPDIMVIADTERECQSTWDYLEEFTKPALKKSGVMVEIVDGAKWKSVGEHGKDYISHNMNTLLIPAFTDESGSIGKLSGYSSRWWKIDPIDRYLSKIHGITRSKYRKWIGFSFDESRRAMRMMNGEEYQKGLIRFPLIHDVTMRRHQVIKYVEDMGWPTPPRSRCWMCPNQSNSEWREIIKNRPDEFEKAVKFEEEMQEFDACAWLHGSCTKLSDVDFSKESDLFGGDYCSSGQCFI